MPITEEPTYSGCATQRYGPDDRDLARLAQVAGGPDPHRLAARGDRHADRQRPTRSAAPAPGRGRRTRSRARRACAPGVATSQHQPRDASGGQPALDRLEHLGDLDVEQAHAIARAAAQVMALADRVPRHGDVERRPSDRCAPGASARRCRRSACRPRRRCASDRCRPTPSARRRRASATRSAIVVCGDTIAAPSAPATTSVGQRLLAGPPQHDRRQPVPRRAARDAIAASRAGGQRLFGHAAPGLSSA